MSMNTIKLLLLIFMGGVFPLGAQTVKGLTYLPEAVKNMKTIPSVVNPKLPYAAQLKIATPAARLQVTPATAKTAALKTAPGATPALERAVTAQVLAQENLTPQKRSKQQLYISRLEGDLDLLEEFTHTHHNWLPHLGHKKYHLRQSVIDNIVYLKKYCGVYNHPLFERYEQLIQKEAQQFKQERYEQRQQERLQAAEQHLQEAQLAREIREQEEAYQQRMWEEMLLQEKAWKAELAEDRQRIQAIAKAEENAFKAARMAEKRLFFDEEATTEDFVIKLLNFYNQISPTGYTFTSGSVLSTPAQWVDKLEKFIAKYHRAPMRSNTITNQQMLDEFRLSAAVYGLTDRLPDTHPDRQRIDQLLASVGMDKEGRIQRIHEQRKAALKKALQGKDMKSPQQWLELIEAFVQEHNRWPSSSIEEERQLYQGARNAINNNPNDPVSVQIKKLKEKYP